jgi:predicted DNA-binding transcriptional regulator AlpA
MHQSCGMSTQIIHQAAPPTLIGPRQVSSQLGISLKALRHHVAAGQIPAPIRVGMLRRWRQLDIDAFVAGAWVPPNVEEHGSVGA